MAQISSEILVPCLGPGLCAGLGLSVSLALLSLFEKLLSSSRTVLIYTAVALQQVSLVLISCVLMVIVMLEPSLSFASCVL